MQWLLQREQTKEGRRLLFEKCGEYRLVTSKITPLLLQFQNEMEELNHENTQTKYLKMIEILGILLLFYYYFFVFLYFFFSVKKGYTFALFFFF